MSTGDQRAAQEAPAPLTADPVRGGDINVVDMRCRHGQVRGHAAPCIIEQRRRGPYPVVEAADDVGTLRGHHPWHFREPDVPADQQADTADRRLEHREPQVTRGEPKLFLVPQMRFAVVPEQAFGAKQYSTVV
ncbi:hypothetical protein D9M71_536980 [compost metagenome]